MGYPYGKTYLEQIQESEYEREAIEKAYYVLVRKYVKESDTINHDTELTLEESFKILGEAFELESDIVGGICDVYHFMWDVLDALLKAKDAGKN